MRRQNKTITTNSTPNNSTMDHTKRPTQQSTLPERDFFTSLAAFNIGKYEDSEPAPLIEDRDEIVGRLLVSTESPEFAEALSVQKLTVPSFKPFSKDNEEGFQSDVPVSRTRQRINSDLSANFLSTCEGEEHGLMPQKKQKKNTQKQSLLDKFSVCSPCPPSTNFLRGPIRNRQPNLKNETNR